MYKIVKIEEYRFNTLQEALKKKDADFWCDSNVRIVEVDEDGKETLVMEDRFFDFQWFEV